MYFKRLLNLLKMVAMCVAVAGVSQGDEIPNDIRTALQANADALSIFEMKYSVKFDYHVKGLPRVASEEHEMYFENGKFYNNKEVSYPNNVSPQKIVYAYDGKIFYKGSATGEGQPILSKLLGVNEDDVEATRFPVLFRYLEAAGFRLPKYVSGWTDAKVQSAVLSLETESLSTRVKTSDGLIEVSFLVLDPAVESAKLVDFNKMRERAKSEDKDEVEKKIARLTWLRTTQPKRRILLTLDPSKNYAVVKRIESTEEGTLLKTIENDQFQSLDSADVWLPTTSRYTNYLKNAGELKGITKTPDKVILSMSEISLDRRPGMDFSVTYGPGASVSDRSSAEAKASPTGEINYIVPADNSTLRRLAGSIRGNRMLFLILSIAIFVAVAGFVFWKRRTA